MKAEIDRIRARTDEYNAASGKPFKLGFSIGVAPIENAVETTFDQIVARADEAMYLDKRRRKAGRPTMPTHVESSVPFRIKTVF